MHDTTTHQSPASRREGTLMGITRRKKQFVAAAIALAGIAGGAVVADATDFAGSTGVTTPPTNWPAIAPTCTSSPCNITIDVGTGTAAVADVVNGAANVPFLGFGVNSAPASLAGSPNSTIKVAEGTVLNITLTQSAGGNPVDLSFPSLAASDVVDNGGGSYTVTASAVGTSVFQPGKNADAPKQIAMGLVGVLIVTPAECVDAQLRCAYDGTVYEDEALLATTVLDLEYATSPGTFDMGYFGQSIDPDFSTRQVYHVINGKAFPDTDVIEARADDDVLLRIVNAGVSDSTLGTLGLRQSLLGRNASAYTDPQTVIAPLVGPGETADVAVKIPAGATAGQFFAISDQGQQMNNGTATGFGGALTFLNVRNAS
jgi:FtsP/CotA-like multicopper oxidase with cupredoxin domain